MSDSPQNLSSHASGAQKKAPARAGRNKSICRWFFYEEIPTGAVVRVASRRKPSRSTIPVRGTWPIAEWCENGLGGAMMYRQIGEVTLGTLNKLRYVGALDAR